MCESDNVEMLECNSRLILFANESSTQHLHFSPIRNSRYKLIILFFLFVLLVAILLINHLSTYPINSSLSYP